MPRKTAAECAEDVRAEGASMRPRPDAAENQEKIGRAYRAAHVLQ